MSECEIADLTETVNFFYLFKPVGEGQISECEILNAKLARAGEEAGCKTRIVLWNVSTRAKFSLRWARMASPHLDVQ